MGYRGFGVPRDEYEPEAELAVAFAFGCKDAEELWELSPRHLTEVRDECLLEYLRKSFKIHFGEDVRIPDSSVYDFREALRICSAEITS
jgi:hypothetical protein